MVLDNEFVFKQLRGGWPCIGVHFETLLTGDNIWEYMSDCCPGRNTHIHTHVLMRGEGDVPVEYEVAKLWRECVRDCDSLRNILHHFDHVPDVDIGQVDRKATDGTLE